jgi:hypothetical protein
MADVINMDDARKKKPAPPPRTPTEISASCIGEVMEKWEKYARRNCLNEFFSTNAAVYTKPEINYLSNIGEIVYVERMLKMQPVIYAPGIINPQQIGWRAGFKFEDILVETPDMASEEYARCCNILIWLRIKRALSEQSKTKV